MEQVMQFIGSYWWLAFPLAGIVGGWAKGVAKFDERRRRDAIELERARRGGLAAGAEAPAGIAQTPHAPQWREDAERVLAEHDAVSRRWLDYELDVAKLIDFPIMTDMREPLTLEFHRAKRTADGLRPTRVEALEDAGRLAEYRDAVRSFEVAFDVAEREARRRRDGDFSEAERQTLDRARKLVTIAVDDAATPAERQSAYRQARKALDGLIVLPDAATDELEHRIAGELGA